MSFTSENSTFECRLSGKSHVLLRIRADNNSTFVYSDIISYTFEWKAFMNVTTSSKKTKKEKKCQSCQPQDLLTRDVMLLERKFRDSQAIDMHWESSKIMRTCGPGH